MEDKMFTCVHCGVVCPKLVNLKYHHRKNHVDIEWNVSVYRKTSVPAYERKRKQRCKIREINNTIPRFCTFIKKNGERCHNYLATDTPSCKVRCALHRRDMVFAATQVHMNTTLDQLNTKHVELRLSGIENAGNGVFTTEIGSFQKGDFITEFSLSRKCSNVAELNDLELRYAVHCPSTWGYNVLVGIQEPTVGLGLGSFINRRVNRNDDNCKIFLDAESQRVFIQATKDIKCNTELLSVYGTTFQIPKVST